MVDVHPTGGPEEVTPAARAERAAAARRLELLASHLSDGAFHLRLQPSLTLTLLNEHLATLVGRSVAELEADPTLLRQHLHPEDMAAVACLAEVGDAEVITTPPHRVCHLDGHQTWVVTTASVERDPGGRPVGLMGVTRDVSSAQAQEQALRAALEQEQRATEELRHVNALKDALLSAVSHELRTPLTVLQGFAELLLTVGDQLVPESRDAAVVALERNARRLSDLLSSILDLDRLGRRATVLSVRELVLSDVVRDVLEAMRLEPGPTVSVDGIRIHADRAKLERILENLVANAVHHGGGTEIRIGATAQDDGVVIEVADRGPGVPDAVKQQVFEPFDRGGASAATPGTGLGLALVAGFVQLHDGSVEVVDRPGGGACFRVWFPAPVTAAVRAGAAR